MKTYVIIYEGFAHFEVILASYFLKTQGDLVTVGINSNSIVSCEGYRIIPDITLGEVDVAEVDVLIIPGGDLEEISQDSLLHDVITRVNKQGKVIGAICSGVYHLAKAGVLNGKGYTTTLDINKLSEFNAAYFKDENCVLDGNVITAKANGYVDFGIKLGEVMGIYEDEDDLKETIDFFKKFKC
ncbi:DJ-1/PfpI family protein [Vallitalea maricola]|uniref:Type 1 glutamine amidotransferase family protein n=1 Tax=Vallitalea maricola TaxID=3074433 RepID=A0ACB5UQ21_9FIRM|nr:type 1 glutamine amidotransferase family protein [Vallitalea sp. AN17-2]